MADKKLCVGQRGLRLTDHATPSVSPVYILSYSGTHSHGTGARQRCKASSTSGTDTPFNRADDDTFDGEQGKPKKQHLCV